ncbi:dihydrolipoamide acetyltransferase family protein [Parafilimonas sp.]|uniref:dihydrolipoamide acetyltransferase family protein n=1 Tax=Parafilimonas sp. TaxID=1969739 RepID=UPI0039E28A81
MAIVDLVMPKLGESIMEATILKWHKKPGDSVQYDETVLDIATDKVDSEVPSTAAGRISEVLFKENDVVPVGSVIARIETDVDAPVENDDVYVPAPAGDVKEEIEEDEIDGKNIPYVPVHTMLHTNDSGKINRFYSPLVMNIAGSEGISMAELESIPGTGNEGRVTKKDILHYVAKRGTVQQVGETGSEALVVDRQTSNVNIKSGNASVTLRPTVEVYAEELPKEYEGNVEIIEMDRMRRLIAKHMVQSKQTSAHVTSFAEADVTNMVLWREKIKKDFEKQNNTRITFTPMFIDCLVKVIKRYPMINSSVDGDRIIIKKDLNIGMATALPGGNLIVPVIKNADDLNLVGLSKKVNHLADAARNAKLKPDDTLDGTFTLTNVGTFGSLMGTPIINQPQVAILAVGAIKKRPVVIETEQGDTIGIRHIMYLSLSYDHRIVDGSLGASFLTAVAREFESWDINRSW